MRTKSTKRFGTLCCALAAGALFYLGSAAPAYAGFLDHLGTAANFTLLSNASLLAPGLLGMVILISSHRLLRRRSADQESLPPV